LVPKPGGKSSVRFLICGLGSIGMRHLRNLEKLGQTDLVLYRSGTATLPQSDLADYPVEDDLRAALERWSPDAVLITNPTALHLEAAIPAARRGCHLLLEKPISDRVEQVDELKSALAAGGGRVLVGFQYRYHPTLLHAKRLVERRELGQPILARANYGDYLPDWHAWEDYRQSYSARAELGGGVLLTLCHPFDYLRWILGEIRSLEAVVDSGQALGLDVDTVALVTLEFEAGVLASVNLDYHRRPPRHHLEIVCTEGTIRWDQADGLLRWWQADRAEWLSASVPDGYERNDMFLDEMKHFVDVIEGASEPACTLEDGVRALEISLAARRSAHEGARVSL